MVFPVVLSAYPLGKAAGVGPPKLVTWPPLVVNTWAVPGTLRRRRGHKCEETRHTLISFNNLVLKPEVGTQPRENLNDLPAPKSFFSFLWPFPIHIYSKLETRAPREESPGAGKV